ncbi:MAG TPA: segregation/condensation protein A [Fibrobacteria bacterium]|nr:segregation/condensation protein A [Fibrobacteria bacterium]
MNLPAKQMVESDYEVKLGVFEGPLDLLLYLVQKNELNPREIQIAVITDQYLKYIDTIQQMNLSNAGEFLVMAARLMRLKARELLPAEQKDELEDMEYELDRQALIQQMLEYQKFKEAARVLRNFEGRNFGAFARGRADSPDDRKEEELEEEAGIFDLLAAFRNVVMARAKRIPVHEVEVDDVTIEDRMQEVELELNEQGRLMFEDLFPHDHRTIMKVVTLMAMLELCKLDRVVFRQSHALGPIWVYRKAKSADYELELKVDEGHQDPLPDFKPGLPELIREQAKARTAQTALEAALRELEEELMNPGAAAEKAAAKAAEEAVLAVEALAAEAAAKEAAAIATQAAADAGVEGAEGAPVPMSVRPEDQEIHTLAGTAAGEALEATEAMEAVATLEAVAATEAEPVMESPSIPVEVGTFDEEVLAGADRVTAEVVPENALGEDGIKEEGGAGAMPGEDEAPTPESRAALKELLDRMREAPEPDLSVPDPDGEDA